MSSAAANVVCVSLIFIQQTAMRQNLKLSFDIAYQIRWSVGDDFKIIISTKSNAVESNHNDESDIIRIYITFLVS